MVTDQIADLLTRIRNAQRARHATVRVPASRTKKLVLEVLRDEGFIETFDGEDDDAGKPCFRVVLRYSNDGQPVIRELSRLSRPGKRRYVGKEEIPRHKGGLGVVVVSTSKGMVSDRRARELGVGGELVCSVF